MPYVKADKLPVQEVSTQQATCFKVVGKWEDLRSLAQQIKCRYILPNATIILVSGRWHTDDNDELFISAKDPERAFELVEQRISEGCPVKIEWGTTYRGALTFEYVQGLEQPETTDLGDLEGQPF